VEVEEGEEEEGERHERLSEASNGNNSSCQDNVVQPRADWPPQHGAAPAPVLVGRPTSECEGEGHKEPVALEDVALAGPVASGGSADAGACDEQVAEGLPEDAAEKGDRLKVARPKSLASTRRTFINAVISFIGSGMYGLPIAFRHIGVIGGVLGMIFVSVVSLHCMFLVVDCRNFLETHCSKQIKTYGDIGFYAFGHVGARVVDFCVMLTQVGFCISYLIVISQSMREVFGHITKRMWIILCLPLLIRASWLRSLKSIAPMSVLAVLTESLAALMVAGFTVQEIFSSPSVPDKHSVALAAMANDSSASAAHELALIDFRGIPYFFGVSIYTFEGIGMVIPVMNSMKDVTKFRFVWGSALALVATINTLFGFLGYMAYRGEVADIIISNLPQSNTTSLMKVSLCLGLFCTYPLMMFPVIEMLEEFLGRAGDAVPAKWNAMRSSLVLGTGAVALLVPKFSLFIALVGASGCALLAFVLPSAFHLKLRYEQMSALERLREASCICMGIVGSILGTMSAIADMRAAFAAEPADAA